ncbi:hypothetical protein K438DRAFT_1752450 [Mycena galopus ATCC 62051]|nr:hypothetical protein K438DRAFT_1752450 [Mycena galopus ATCC 62051]
MTAKSQQILAEPRELTTSPGRTLPSLENMNGYNSKNEETSQVPREYDRQVATDAEPREYDVKSHRIPVSGSASRIRMKRTPSPCGFPLSLENKTPSPDRVLPSLENMTGNKEREKKNIAPSSQPSLKPQEYDVKSQQIPTEPQEDDTKS